MSRTSDLHCIWVWSAMETRSAQLEAAASWASPPFLCLGLVPRFSSLVASRSNIPQSEPLPRP
ncbi:Hypothetical predicted protein [Xyrichtys novacula]|uniref:Uncharacterized protein n=1 Tax=Xyrichtys novacula TaxID=13765 RepID=A0AAV1G3H6_XYRNO|nr:Hypothetical predicted protein [Xyrichtys novacula]